MMKIDIKHIAKLSRLRIEEVDLDRFQQQMQGIVEMVEQMPAREGMTQLAPENRMELRADEIKPSLRREELLANAPEVAAGCVAVPKTLEGAN